MKAKKPVIAVLVLISLMAASYWYYHYYKPGDAAVLEASGTIEAMSVDLNARVSGTIDQYTVKEGDTVTRNQLLVELSRNDLVAQRERDALGVAAAEANLNDLLSGARAEEIKEASSQLSISAASLEKAQLDLERAEKLLAAGAISEAEVQQIKLNRDITQQQLDASQAHLALLQEGTRPAKIQAASAELERSKAVLQASDAVLGDLKVYSPIDGLLADKNYETGEFVQIGARLGTVIDLQNLWIKVYIPTDDLPAIELGQEARISVSGSNKTFTGTVVHIASKGEFTPKTIQTKKERTHIVYAVKVAVQNQDNILKPGMPADLTFDWKERHD